MGVDSLSQLCTWFDAAYGVHPELKIHTSGCMYFGYGVIYCNSRKQKLNIKISTEAKLVCISDYLTYNIWICLFMIAQGYNINQNILFQDNQSAIHIKKGIIRALGTICTSIYVSYFLRNVLKATTCQFHTASQSTCLPDFNEIPTKGLIN